MTLSTSSGRKLNILHIGYNLVGQGSYWRLFHFGRHLAQRGHRVTLVATAHKRRRGIEETSLEGMRLVTTPDLFHGSLRSGYDPWNTLNRLAWLRGQSFDLVYALESRPTVIYPSLYLHRVKHIPLVMGWSDWFGRGGSVEQRPNPLIRTVLRPVETYYEEHFRPQADASTAICTMLRDKAVDLGVDPESIRVIPNGCDESMIRPTTTAEARQAAGLPPEGLRIGYVGSIFKGDAMLMAQAFDRLVECLPGVKLMVVGNCPVRVGEFSNHAQDIIQTGSVGQEQLYNLLASCDVFWLPHRDTNANRGRWPGKINDFTAIGRPIVATGVGDVKILLTEEPIGLLSPDQPEPFAEQTLRLLQDPALRQEMGQRAQQVARTRFNLVNLTNELEEIYALAIQRHSNKLGKTKL